MEFKPVDKNSRIEAIDAVRGFALLGIIIANIPFPMDNVGDSNTDSILTFLYYFLVDKKFITIFSILFGLGFHMQLKKAESSGVNFTTYFAGRMILLFAIGTLHAFLISNGDILRAYATGGILLMLIRNWNLKRLLVAAFISNILLTGIVYIGNSEFGWQVYNYDYALATELPVTTSYTRYLAINAILDPWVNFLKDMPVTLFYTTGNIIIGFILGKTGYLLQPEKMKELSSSLLIFGTVISLACSYIYYRISTGAIEISLPLLWLPFVLAAGMLVQALIYMFLVIRLFSHPLPARIFRLFAITGRASLSNYIFQSLFYLLLFYHCSHTFRLFGKLSLAETWITGITLFIFQALLSYLWLKKYSQGPLEYLWKKFSYSMATQINTDN